MFLPTYAIDPLHLIADNQIADDRQNNIGSNLWKEQSDFTEWLDSKESDFVVFINFGSIAVLTPQKMLEFAWQQTNCWFACNKWGIGVEINGDVKRDQVGKLVRESMEGERGNEMKKKAMEWKTKAYEAASPSGSSCRNFENLLADILLVQKTEIHLRKVS
uniref:Anthocyanidin 3-O-glucosyltransferase n=1 Tax=Populus trichocarpa TaxID=3694 RepID=A0A2K1XER1_POPTR